MLQQTHREHVRSREMVQVQSGIGRLIGAILKGIFTFVGKVFASVGEGFQIFVSSAEKHGLPRNH